MTLTAVQLRSASRSGWGLPFPRVLWAGPQEAATAVLEFDRKPSWPARPRRLGEAIQASQGQAESGERSLRRPQLLSYLLALFGSVTPWDQGCHSGPKGSCLQDRQRGIQTPRPRLTFSRCDDLSSPAKRDTKHFRWGKRSSSRRVYTRRLSHTCHGALWPSSPRGVSRRLLPFRVCLCC